MPDLLQKSPSFHLLKYCFFLPFQMKHAFWSISSFLALPLQACLCGAAWMNWSHHSVVPTSSVTPQHIQDNIRILRCLAGSSTICPRLTQSLSPQTSHLTLLLSTLSLDLTCLLTCLCFSTGCSPAFSTWYPINASPFKTQFEHHLTEKFSLPLLPFSLPCLFIQAKAVSPMALTAKSICQPTACPSWGLEVFASRGWVFPWLYPSAKPTFIVSRQ